MLKLEKITYALGDKTILTPQNLHLKKQEHLLLLGGSGSGKTTLMNIMAGLLKPSTGNITFNGKDYAALSGKELDILRAKHFGFIFQKLHLIGHLTIAENIALAQNAADKERINALISDLALPQDKKQKAKDLSVGEAQRVAIARAVANTPQVIFADEPTSALDDKNTKIVMDLLLSQAEKTGATLVVATHDARIKKHFKTIMEIAA